MGSLLQIPAQPPIAGDPPAGGDATDADLGGGGDEFGGESVHDRRADSGAQVAEVLGRIGQAGILLEEDSNAGLETAETKQVIGFVAQRSRKLKAIGPAFFGQAVQHRAPGVGETQEFCGLVEAFARGIVEGATEDHLIEFGADMNQQGVSARCDERDMRRDRGAMKLGRFAGDPWGVQVGFVVVDANHGQPACRGQRLGGCPSDHQGRGQSGPSGGGHGGEFGHGNPCGFQGLTHNRD